MNRSAHSLAIGWLLCLGAVGYFIWESQTRGTQFDSAFIAYRYADNLVRGEGWVYNLGQVDEGIAGFLWTLLIAGGMALGIQAETVGRLLSAVFSVAILIAAFRFASYQLREKWAWLSGFAPWIVLATVAFPVWASSGTDLPLFTLCITIALMAAARQRIWIAAGASIAATLARPEGVIVALIVFISTVRLFRTARARWMVSLIAYGLSVALLFGFRLAYFESLLPVGDMNLVRPDPVALVHFALVGASTSITRFFTTGTVLLTAPLVVSAVRDPFYRPAVLYCATAAIYSIAFEANGWTHTPLLSYALPVLCAVAIHGCERCWAWDKALGSAAISAVVITLWLQAFGGIGFVFAYAFIAYTLALSLYLIGKKRAWRPALTAGGFTMCALFIVIPLQKPLIEKWPVLLPPTRCWYLDSLHEINTRAIDDIKPFIEILAKNGERPLLASDRIGRLGFVTGCPMIDLYGRIGRPYQDRRSSRPTRSDAKTLLASMVADTLQRAPEYIFYDVDSRINKSLVALFNKNSVFDRTYAWDSRIEGFWRRDAPLVDQRELAARLRAAPKEKMPEARPNIVLISIDTLRADHLRSHGYMRETAPALTRLATRGIRFERAISQAPWTLPAMASILTSQYPYQHGAVTSTSLMPSRTITIAEILGTEGYATIGVVSNDFVSRKRGFAQGFDRFDENVVPEQDEITSSTITRIATAYLASLEREPFFLWTHYMDPHYTYIRHPQFGFASKYRSRFGDRIEIIELAEHQESMRKALIPILDPDDLNYLNAVYDEEIAFTDASIDRLLKTIDMLGFAHPTVFIVVADHGEFFGEHNHFGHPEYLYEELIHVPLIIGGNIDASLAGRVVEQTVETRNIPITIMNLVRGTRYEFEGVDLMEVARGDVAQTGAFSETNCSWDPNCGTKTALTYGNWKLITNRQKERSYEFYWLTFDKGEKENIWKQESVKSVRGPLELKLNAFIKQVKASKRSRESEFKLSPRQEKKLRGLGYVQ